MSYPCPKDSTHQSEDPDYCSVCGAKIGGAALLSSTAGPNLNGVASAGTDICPDCGLARHAGAKFCEVCRYNFETHSSALLSAAVPAPPASALPEPSLPPKPDMTAAANSSTGAAFLGWEALVSVDPSLYVEPDPQAPCPANEPDRTFPLDLAENLIGRRSDRRDIHPEVPLSDSGVSHRHAKILRQPDGSLGLLDLGSTNGTQMNGKDVPAGIRTSLQSGDQITLGCWTRITIRTVQGA